MFVYETFSDTSLGVNITLLTLVGVLVNGPYALITTAVSADLGTHESLQGNAKALATVTAIIDGTGSIGDLNLMQPLVKTCCLLWDVFIQYICLVFSFVWLKLPFVCMWVKANI